MIKDIKYKIPCKPGSITSGIKTLSKNNKEIPKAVDYFNISGFPELINAYGEKPNKLVLFFPTNDIESFLDLNYVLYGSNNQLIRKCDGENCFHRIENEINGNKFSGGSTTPCVCKEYDLQREHKKKCRPFFWMKAFVGDVKLGKVDSPMCYLFKSGSKNSGENIISELNKVKNITGNIVGIPFGLSVKMVPGSENPNIKFPIWELQGLGSITQMKAWNESVAMLIPKKEELKQLNEPPIPEDDYDESLFSDDLKPDNIQYWINPLKMLKTITEVDKYVKENEQGVSMFPEEDQLEFAEAVGNRKQELKGENKN